MTNLHSNLFTDMILVKQYKVIENSMTTMYTYLRFGYIAEISYEEIEEKWFSFSESACYWHNHDRFILDISSIQQRWQVVFNQIEWMFIWHFHYLYGSASQPRTGWWNCKSEIEHKIHKHNMLTYLLILGSEQYIIQCGQVIFHNFNITFSNLK